ncbi:6752_t:CDS:1, partial [Racocetra persica]
KYSNKSKEDTYRRHSSKPQGLKSPNSDHTSIEAYQFGILGLVRYSFSGVV